MKVKHGQRVNIWIPAALRVRLDEVRARRKKHGLSSPNVSGICSVALKRWLDREAKSQLDREAKS